MATEEKYNGIGTEAVKTKTGKSWSEWFKILDKEKAAKLPHKEIANLLLDKYKIPGWWCQMVTVGYEQAKGLRVKNERPGGAFSVDISKVLEAPLDNLYEWTTDEAKRTKWLKGKVEVRKANENKSIRANFDGGAANLTFMFYAKGTGKAQVVITESKLKDAKQAEERRVFWKNAVERLAKLLA